MVALIQHDIVHQPSILTRVYIVHYPGELEKVFHRIYVEPTIRNCVMFSTNAITILETVFMVGASNIPSLAVDTIAVVELMIHLTAIDADAMVIDMLTDTRGITETADLTDTMV